MPRGKELDVYTRERICELKFTLKWGARRIQKYRFPEIPLSTISYTLTMERKRINSASLPRSGQPRKLTEEDRDRVNDAIQNNPAITREDLLNEVDYKVKMSVHCVAGSLHTPPAPLSYRLLSSATPGALQPIIEFII